MSEHWYRHSDWNDDIAAGFETRIARSRTQKAQYLMIQGQALIERHPDVARGLLMRSIALDDEYFLNQANCYLAMAHLALGEVEAALAAYLAALEAQLRLPNFQSSAPLDYAFIVAWFARADHYPAALPILEAVGPSIFPGANFQATAAHALILADVGRDAEARDKALAALKDEPEEPEGPGTAAWGGISMADLHRRLAAIAGQL